MLCIGPSMSFHVDLGEGKTYLAQLITNHHHDKDKDFDMDITIPYRSLRFLNMLYWYFTLRARLYLLPAVGRILHATWLRW